MNTVKLNLPYMAAAQAQKHVTHNEAIRDLDTLVQLNVISRDLNQPPTTNGNGESYIIADTPSGDWSGKQGQIASWQDNGWYFYPPKTGWRCWVFDEDKLCVWNGTGWAEVSGGGGSTAPVNPAALVGVNITADTANRLAVSSSNSLFTHEGDSHRIKVNKAAVGDTASLVFQDDFSGHAEMGLTGDDDFHFKVSVDGSTWKEALIIDKATGGATFPNTTFGGGGGSNPNLFINGSFQVKQRGFAGGTLANGVYGYDRWKADGSNAVMSVSGDIVTLTSGIIAQVHSTRLICIRH